MFDTVEDVEGTVDVFRLVLTKVEVNSVEGMVERDGLVEHGKEEPRAEMVTRDMVGNPRPDFWRCTVTV